MTVAADQSGQEVLFRDGEALQAVDCTDEQRYQRAARAALAAGLNGTGVLWGLDVGAVKGSGGGAVTALQVTKGAGFLPGGQLVQLSTNETVPLSQGTGKVVLWIDLATHEKGRAAPDRVVYRQEVPRLGWTAQDDWSADGTALALALVDPASPGTPDAEPRRYSAIRAGLLELGTDVAGVQASVAAWGSGGNCGFDIDADLLAVAPLTGSAAQVRVQKALGVGTMAPQAVLEIAPPVGLEPGPGRITSRGRVVTVHPPGAGAALAQGFSLFVDDGAAGKRSTKVLAPVAGGGWEVSESLNVTDAEYWLRRPLSARMGNARTPAALAIDLAGNAGWGTDHPQARLDVDGGSLEIAGFAPDVTLEGAGSVVTQAGGQLEIVPRDARLSLTAPGGVSWRTANITSRLTAQGRWGIGCNDPGVTLDVAGFIQSTAGGFVFPDGSVQNSAEISVPIGAIIDWWRGSSDQEVPANYRICDGSVIAKTKGVLDGVATPDLSEKFTVGTSDPSQTNTLTGDPNHSHCYITPSHSHAFPHSHPDLSDRTTGKANETEGMAGSADPNARKEHTHQFSAPVSQTATTHTGINSTFNDPGTTKDTAPLPPYIGLLKLVRVA